MKKQICIIQNISCRRELKMYLHYIRFGSEEKKLFHFLFQTNQFSGYSLDELIDSAELSEILHMVSMGTKCDEARAKELFMNLFIVAHGCASLLANNAIEYEQTNLKKFRRMYSIISCSHNLIV